MNFPPPFNPSKAPETPGYRLLGVGEIVGDKDQCHDFRFGVSNPVWVDVVPLLHLPVDKSWSCAIRRPLSVDDKYAPPPEEWTREGYKVSGPVAVNSYGAIENEESWFEGRWQKSLLLLTYWFPAYIRHPIVSTAVSSFKLKPGQTVVVCVGNNQALSLAVQQIAFAAGIKWSGVGASVLTGVVAKGNRVVLVLDRCKNTLLWQGENVILPSQSVMLDARTDMGKLIDLLDQPPVPAKPVPPTINGYIGQYVRGGFGQPDIMRFGCADISMSLVHRLARFMGLEGDVGGNRKVAAITLDSGVKLTVSDIESILQYVDEVNKAA